MIEVSHDNRNEGKGPETEDVLKGTKLEKRYRNKLEVNDIKHT